jgi:hypothetical protein
MSCKGVERWRGRRWWRNRSCTKLRFYDRTRLEVAEKTTKSALNSMQPDSTQRVEPERLPARAITGWAPVPCYTLGDTTLLTERLPARAITGWAPVPCYTLGDTTLLTERLPARAVTGWAPVPCYTLGDATLQKCAPPILPFFPTGLPLEQ